MVWKSQVSSPWWVQIDATKANEFCETDAHTHDTLIQSYTVVWDRDKTVADQKHDIFPAAGRLIQTTGQAVCSRLVPVSTDTNVTMHRLQEADRDSAAAVNSKRRRIHMNVIDCDRHSATEHGGQPLKKPALTKTSSKDPNCGLYPRDRKSNLKLKKSIASASFVSAKEMYQSIEHVHLQDIQPLNKPVVYNEPSKCSTTSEALPLSLSSSRNTKHHKKKLPAQSNSLLNYFKRRTDKERTVSSSPETSPVKTSCLPRTVSSSPETSPVKTSCLPRTVSSSPETRPVKTSCLPRTVSSSPETSPVKTSCLPRTGSSQQDILQQFGFSQTSVNNRPHSEDIISQNLSNQIVNSFPKQISQSISMSSQSSIDANRIASAKTSTNPHQSNQHNLGVDARNTSFVVAQNPSVQTSCKDMYGLLGTGLDDCIDLGDDEDDIDLNYFSQLPVEVIENILCRLPTHDLLLNVCLVCSQWNDIITAPKFMPWKKHYYKLTIDDPAALDTMKNLLQRHEMTTPDTYLPGMIRWMKDFKPLTANDMDECLQKQSLYTTATSMISERLSECLCKGVVNPWSVMAAIVVLADSVAQLQQLLQCLLGGDSQCTAMEVLESCYCIACFLRVFRSIHYQDLWTGMHYRMYYALYLFENDSVSTCGELAGVFSGRSGQQSIMKYSSAGTSVRLTHEQLRICNHNVQPGQLIKIIAFAGTGKTTTLVRYTQLRPNFKFLLVVYNKSVCELSKSKFPRNVTCKTGHALAFQTTGRRYAGAKQLWSNIRLTAITDIIPRRKGLSLFVRAKFVLDTLKTYFASADPSITTAHVPTEKVDSDGHRTPLDHAIRMEVADDAETLWREMRNIQNGSIGMTHDGYLKLYQLSQPRLLQYDVILIDEAQDLTPAIADMLLRQPQPKILVGDPHQQIYSFRGAVNSMQLVNASHTFYLTQSFRFGPEIAFVAATFLEVLKGEKKTLVGNGVPGGILGEQVGQLAIITRTNYTLFMEAVKRCCYSDENIRVAFVGGTEAFGFRRILDIYSLMLPPQDRAKRPITDAFVRNFESLADLERYANQAMDHELLGKIRIVKTCHHNLPSLIDKIRSKAIGDTDTADVVFSTAHKAKGLEFSTVRVTDDFQVLPNPDSFRQVEEEITEDEKNLLYVAVTRARKRLQLTSELLRLLKRSGEGFWYLTASSRLPSQELPLRCLLTGREDWTLPAVTLARHRVRLGDGSVKEGGLVCPQAVSEGLVLPNVRHLVGSLRDERDCVEEGRKEQREDN